MMVFTLQPVLPMDEWLADLDATIAQSPEFFTSRPVVLNVAPLKLGQVEVTSLVDELKSRYIRLVAVEGTNPAWLERALAPLDGSKIANIVEFPNSTQTATQSAATNRPAAESTRPALGEQSPLQTTTRNGTVLIESRVPSGDSIVNLDGDVIVTGAVSSGAEIVAAGSIHVYGALRGRAFAGSEGDRQARIFCRRFEAELVAIDGYYCTSEMVEPSLVGKPIQTRLEGQAIIMNIDS
jgi:septum site-determining protein MinC